MINWLRQNHFLHDWGEWSYPKYHVWDEPKDYYREKFCKRCKKVKYQSIGLKLSKVDQLERDNFIKDL